jgi:hypothetical protein
MIDPFCRDPGEIDVQALRPNAVARLHGHQRTGSISVPPPNRTQRRKRTLQQRLSMQTDPVRLKQRWGRG